MADAPSSTEIINDALLTNLSWAIILVPMISAVLLMFFRFLEVKQRRTIDHPPLYTIVLGVGSLLTSLVLTIIVAVQYATAHGFEGVAQSSFNMIPGELTNGTLELNYGVMIDPLSMLMTLLLAVIASAIHVYAAEYMKHGEKEVTRFFAFLNFFTGSMFGFVLANNLFHSFIFWELLGVSSYFLIGYYWHKPEAAHAAKKAFLYNKVGDVAFMVGIFMVLINEANPTKTLNYVELNELTFDPASIVIAGVLLFGAAIGKSSQFPLFGWLPEAMEGPTPVSSLLHSSTMVKAGLFLLMRNFFFLYDIKLDDANHLKAYLPDVGFAAATLVLWIGIITALLGALMASVEFDFKRILAFSTISQLGYIAAAIGAGGNYSGFFHLTSHATFKSLLFLCAGAVIHNTHNTKDIRHMGDLKRHMSTTFWTTAIGLFALAGFPFFSSGFYSKDAVLLSVEKSAVPGAEVAFGIGVFTAFITAFYVTRMLILVFFGKPRFDNNKVIPHESAFWMRAPLMFLAGLVVLQSVYWMITTLGGFHWTFSEHWFGEVLGVYPKEFSWTGAWISTVAVLAGLGLGYFFYWGKPENVEKSIWGAFAKVIEKRFYMDILIYGSVDRVFLPIGRVFRDYGDAVIDRVIIDSFVRNGTLQVADASDKVDRNFIDGIVNGLWKMIAGLGRLIRPIQNGLTGYYARYMIIGLVLILLSFNIFNFLNDGSLF